MKKYSLRKWSLKTRRLIMVVMAFVLFFTEGFYMRSLAKEKEESTPGSLYAQSAVLMDGDSGRVLYEKNGQEFLSNASTTKILTCILALEEADLTDIVTVSAYAATMPDVQLHIREGEKYLLEDLLYSLMLESHNDVAVAIAEHVAGSVARFSALMNQKAKEIGCKNTFFLTPNGLDAVIVSEEMEKKEWSHGTTAEDLALLMRYCILISSVKELFCKITSTTSHQFSDLEKKRNYTCHNHNSLFNLVEGVVSGKTGFTNKAGYCYVGAVNQNGKKYIMALLACGWPGNKNYKWEDCKKLLEYGSEEYQLVKLQEIDSEYNNHKDFLLREAQSEGWERSVRVPLMDTETEFETVLLKQEEMLEVQYQWENVTAPVSAGQKVGSRKYYIDGELWREEGLFSKENVKKIDFRWCLEKIVNKIV